MTQLSHRECAFFGRITASATHELKNVLAIIYEASGLMQDLLELSKEKPAHYDRLQKALTSIKGQIQRGQDLIANLNRFSHGPDIAVRSLDLFEGVDHLVSLSQRFAALKNVSLKVIRPPSAELPIQLTANLVHLQMVLFSAIECMLAVAAPGNAISIHLSKGDGSCEIWLTCEEKSLLAADWATALTALENWIRLKDITEFVGGRVEIIAQKVGVRLSLPTDLCARVE